jgi:MFS transporter, YNFM family, putative membrane transport protein
MNPADIATSEHATNALLPPAAALGPTKFRCVIVVLAAAIFAGAASMRLLDALLPTIAKTYGATIGGAGLTVTAYAVSYSLCQLVYGPLGDRVGPFRVIGWTAGASALAALGCALAPSLGWLVGL